MKMLPLALAVTLLSPNLFASVDKDTQAACEAAAELAKGDDLKAAAEEARWCLEGIEQTLQSMDADLFTKEINGWNRGEVTTNKAMGMTLTETSYTKEGSHIQVSLNTGTGAIGNVMAQMGMMQGVKRVRLGKHKGIFTSENELAISFDGGRLLTLQGDGVDTETLTEFAKALPLDKLSGQ